MAIVSKEWFTVQSISIAAPLLAVTIAVVFDAGYFLSADLDFFPLFSVSEHIVLAARGFLTALGYVVLAGIVQAWVFWDIEHRYGVGSAARGEFTWWQKYRPCVLGGVPLVALGAAWAWHILPATVLFALVALLTFPLYLMHAHWQRHPGWLLAVVLSANLGFVYCLGLATAHCGRGAISFLGFKLPHQCLSIAADPHRILVDGFPDPISGRLLASGERGVLFSSQDAVYFWKWDIVREIWSAGGESYLSEVKPKVLRFTSGRGN
jgi:hypothetical protein